MPETETFDVSRFDALEAEDLDPNDRYLLRTSRDLDEYRKFFGEDIAVEPGLVLDVGAGNSPFATEVRESPDHAGRVIRADLSYAFHMPEDPVDAVAADVRQLPFEDDTFEQVVSSHCLMHFDWESAASAIGEMLRVTKPDGTIGIFPGHERWSQRVPEPAELHQVGWSRLFGSHTVAIAKTEAYLALAGSERRSLHYRLAQHVSSGPLGAAVSRRVQRAVVKHDQRKLARRTT
ncbi:MAG: class I SAM-dependent methyltransferase [Patescibacteria group bacterium]